jgi:hypothetical protein
VLFDCGNQQFRIVGTFGEHFIVRDDLVLGLLHFNQVAELVRLTRFPFANDFRVRLENTQDLMGINRPWGFPITAGPMACPSRACVLASGTFSSPMRVNASYIRFARTSRSSVS